MPLYLCILFYCIRIYSLTRCVADNVVTFATSSSLNLHFSLAVLLIILKSGDIQKTQDPHYIVVQMM